MQDIFCLHNLRPAFCKSLLAFPILAQDMVVTRRFLNFLYLLFGCPQANFIPLQGGNGTHPVLITALFLVQPKGYWEPHNQVESQSWAQHIKGIRTVNIPILSVMSNPNVLLSKSGSKFKSGSQSTFRNVNSHTFTYPLLVWNQHPLPLKAIYHFQSIIYQSIIFLEFSENINNQVSNNKYLLCSIAVTIIAK